jgi:starch synthase
MKNRLKILMVFSEVAPFSKTGGLADVGGALPKALKEMGHDVRVITPQYRRINERKYVLRDVIRLQNIEIPMGEKRVTVNVKSAFLPNSKVQIYFVDYRPYFFREGIYIDPKTNTDYPDNADRFILFCKGVLETLKKLQWQPDVIHCNDWQTGMIPFLLKYHNHEDPFYNKIHTLLTVHNFAFQGNFDPVCLKKLDIPESFVFKNSRIDWFGKCNFLKTGLLFSDRVNTVSEKYAQEASSSDRFGFGMDQVIKQRRDKLKGVLNGVDYQVWNPETDPYISHHYSVEDMTGKIRCRETLINDLGLEADDQLPIVSVISRLTEQKGIHLVQDIFPDLIDLPVCFILLGLGESQFHTFFKKMAKKYPKRVSVHLKLDDLLAHKIIAGSDILLMPSLFEPCGLTQLYALKYGTIPVVFETGGLADTIKPFTGGASHGTGFVFHKASGKSMLTALKQAITVVHDVKARKRVNSNGMKSDFSWEKSAKQYIQLYQTCIGK